MMFYFVGIHFISVAFWFNLSKVLAFLQQHWFFTAWRVKSFVWRGACDAWREIFWVFTLYCYSAECLVKIYLASIESTGKCFISACQRHRQPVFANRQPLFLMESNFLHLFAFCLQRRAFKQRNGFSKVPYSEVRFKTRF